MIDSKDGVLINALYDTFLIELGILMLFRDKLSTNEYFSIFSRLELDDTSTFSNFSHPENVNGLIILTFNGTLNEEIDVSEKACEPISQRFDFSISILNAINEWQSLKAPSPIDIVLLDNVNEMIPVRANASSSIISPLKTTSFNCKLLENAFLWMIFTDSGQITFWILVFAKLNSPISFNIDCSSNKRVDKKWQFSNKFGGIISTVLGTVNCVRL